MTAPQKQNKSKKKKSICWYHIRKTCDRVRRPLPFVGWYHLPVNRPPFMTQILTQWPHFSLQSTPNDPIFPNFNVNFDTFCALHTHLKNFVKFQLKMSNFHSNLIQFTPNPQFGKFTPNDLLKSVVSYTEWSLFSFSGRHTAITFIFICPSRWQGHHQL